MELNEKQKTILEVLYSKGGRYIARNDYGELRAFAEKPVKLCQYWNANIGEPNRLIDFLDIFPNIKWSDEEPFDIAKALGIVDWSTVPVDTKILVRSDDTGKWFRRYFAKYEDGKVYAFKNGRTSWTETYTTSWEYAKLAEENNDE